MNWQPTVLLSVRYEYNQVKHRPIVSSRLCMESSSPGDLNWVHSMAVAADGTIYFGDVQGKRAQKFMPVGVHSSN